MQNPKQEEDWRVQAAPPGGGRAAPPERVWVAPPGGVRAAPPGRVRVAPIGSDTWTSADSPEEAGPSYRTCNRSPLRRRGVTVPGQMSTIHEL